LLHCESLNFFTYYWKREVNKWIAFQADYTSKQNINNLSWKTDET